jgi:hypothetical protein
MRTPLLAALLATVVGLPAQRVDVSPSVTITTDGDPAPAEALVPVLRRAQARVEAFFGAPFTDRVEVRLAADRKAFDALLAARWQMPATECWMVAAADATAMPVLDPRTWNAQACEHDGTSAAHVSSVLTHELVHAYHGQHNPKADLSLPDEMGWFAEGLAVFASGQLEDGHLADPREAVATGRAPAHLADAWSGKYRYGVSGTLVREAERIAGRPAIVRALGATTPEALLSELGTTEARLLASWRDRLAAQ